MGIQDVIAVLVALAGLGASAVSTTLARSVTKEAQARVQTLISRASGREVTPASSVDDLEERLTQPSLEDRAVRVAELLKESGSILDELTAEMTARAATLEQLRVDAEQAQRVAEIHKEQQEAVAKVLRLELEKQEEQLRSELARTNRRSFWQGFAVNVGVGLLFFIAGLLAPIGLR